MSPHSSITSLNHRLLVVNSVLFLHVHNPIIFIICVRISDAWKLPSILYIQLPLGLRSSAQTGCAVARKVPPFECSSAETSPKTCIPFRGQKYEGIAWQKKKQKFDSFELKSRVHQDGVELRICKNPGAWPFVLLRKKSKFVSPHVGQRYLKLYFYLFL